MNTDTAYFKKDIVNSINAFNELEKVRLNYVPKKESFNIKPIQYTT
jgi:hypothetical protein